MHATPGLAAHTLSMCLLRSLCIQPPSATIFARHHQCLISTVWKKHKAFLDLFPKKIKRRLRFLKIMRSIKMQSGSRRSQESFEFPDLNLHRDLSSIYLWFMPTQLRSMTYESQYFETFLGQPTAFAGKMWFLTVLWLGFFMIWHYSNLTIWQLGNLTIWQFYNLAVLEFCNFAILHFSVLQFGNFTIIQQSKARLFH